MRVIIYILCLLLSDSMGLLVGENCALQDANTNGTCLAVHDCDHAIKKSLEQSKTPQYCGPDVVCCPIAGIYTLETFEHYHLIPSQVYGVANGVAAKPQEFPHMAAVGFGDKTNILWRCGASLISDRYVLTAAHCVHSHEAGPARWVRLGDLHLKNNTDDYKIEKAITHPDYKPPLHYNDIALLKLDQKVLFRPACLHVEHKLPESVFTVIGWGKTGYFGDPSSHLLKAQVSHIVHAECAARFAAVSARKLPKGILEKFQICAGDAEGRDTCPGDSGGPLQVNNTKTSHRDCDFIVVGITSFGKSCGAKNSAGVYTRVFAYVSWIQSIVSSQY